MAVERTLSIIKPDATRRNLTGEIVARFEKAGLRVVAQKRMRLTRQQAEAFYAVHKERPFFDGLVEFMTSGPVVVQVLEGEGAVAKNREVMGATDPEEGRPRHHPQGLRREHRGQLGARLGCAGDGGQRNPLLLQRPRNRRLINRPVGASDRPRRPSRSGRLRIRVSAREAHRRAASAQLFPRVSRVSMLHASSQEKSAPPFPISRPAPTTIGVIEPACRIAMPCCIVRLCSISTATSSRPSPLKSPCRKYGLMRVVSA